MSSLRLRGVMHPLRHMSSWRGACLSRRIRFHGVVLR